MYYLSELQLLQTTDKNNTCIGNSSTNTQANTAQICIHPDVFVIYKNSKCGYTLFIAALVVYSSTDAFQVWHKYLAIHPYLHHSVDQNDHQVFLSACIILGDFSVTA